MATSVAPKIFVVHAPQDAWFVEGFLLPSLHVAADQILVSSRLDLGAPIIQAIARGAVRPITAVVVSPAFLASSWAQFASDLAQHHSIENPGDNTTVIPLLLEECQPSLLLRSLVSLDFRSQHAEHWEAQAVVLRARLAAQTRASSSVALPCPYPGIRAFTFEESAHFHGRDDEIRELLDRLRHGARELYVIGPSGSGKSSLVTAGLLPQLRSVPSLAGGSFQVFSMRPGEEPLLALIEALTPSDIHGDTSFTVTTNPPAPEQRVAQLLARYPVTARFLLFIDQLEELFATSLPVARVQFLAALSALRSQPRVTLVLALRADFYATFMESELWTDLGGKPDRLDISPLRGAKLRSAIEQPARALGVHLEPVLVERLLRDAAAEPGILPLLQDTLFVLWHQRTHNILRLAEYEAMSQREQTGLAVTVARRANTALHQLSVSRQQIARRIFLRLIQFGEGIAPTRRQQTRLALATADDAPSEIDAVIAHLAAHFLLITSGGDIHDLGTARIDLAHEALLSAWPTLGEWFNTQREEEHHRRILEAKATEWVKYGRGASRLLDTDELREARGWLTEERAKELGASAELHSLLVASEAALAEQRRTEDALNREIQRQLARGYQAQGYALLLDGRPAQAAPYLLAAREAGLDDISLRSMFQWAKERLPLLQVAQSGLIRQVAWSPNGAAFATVSEKGTVQVWSAQTGETAAPPLRHAGEVLCLAWSPSGNHLATGGTDHIAIVWNARTGQLEARLLGDGVPICQAPRKMTPSRH